MSIRNSPIADYCSAVDNSLSQTENQILYGYIFDFVNVCLSYPDAYMFLQDAGVGIYHELRLLACRPFRDRSAVAIHISLKTVCVLVLSAIAMVMPNALPVQTP